MKKTYIIAVLAVFTATSAMALSVVGSRHDMVFSGFATGAGGSTEVCVFCHTPHGAQTSEAVVPLWNNTAVASVDATVYTSATMNFVADQAAINATDARLCLACHDGAVGMPVNQPNSGDMDPTGTLMSPDALLSTNLSNDHPIGMDLTDAPETIDPYIHAMADITGPAGFNGENPFYGVDNTMWCSSCHDVHDNENVPFLRISNVGSAMCKACHIK